MKILVVSDIHGSDNRFRRLLEFYYQEQMKQIIILGDTFGGLYSLTTSAKEISNMLESVMHNLIVIRGNCDSLYDVSLSPIGMVDVYKGNINNKNIICFHGNKKVFFDQKTIDIVMSGHTHHYSLRKENGIIYLNPGSLTYPRDGSKGSFAVITDDGITIFDVDYKILAELYFKA